MDGESSRYDKLESMLQDGSSEPHNLPLEYLRNITNNFSDERLLGEGGFGTVYKGVLPNGEMIAVKKLNSSIPGVKDRHFENEAYHLMRLKHPNVVLLVGWCSETENIFVQYNGKYIYAEKSERLLCLEYMPKGSLRRYLSDEASGLGWDTRYRIIEGICCGLHYLHEEWQHSTPIIHMDLKPANVLLDNNMVPKIADFGLSRLFSEEKTWTCTINRDGTLGYMAPEYINKGLITTKSDIFSLGVIIIEIVTGHRDYPDENGVSPQEFIDLVLKKWRNRLQKTAGYEELYYYQQIRRCIQIGLVCVDPDRSKRPTTSQIIKMLHVESVDLSGRKRTDHSPGSSFSEGADDDPLPGIEGLRITGEAFPGRELLASGNPINGTTTCNFEMNEAVNAIMNNLTGKSYVVDREPHPSPGRGSDRPTSRGDRRGPAMADDRWTKGVPLSPGHDMDLANGPSIINYRGGLGGNHGVLRNPCAQPGGGLLLGPMHSVGPQVSRSGSDADRWQQKGLIPSPVTPMQVMHKAERKYVVGKVSDEEEAKQRQLKAIVNKLTLQNFEELFEQVKEVNIDSAATLTGVISQIFDIALMEPTFCEMYANFCFHLAGALPDFSEDNEKITFKRLLLNKCQEEFERGVREEAEADKTEEEGEIKQTKEVREEKRIRARRRMLGKIRLIGELYKKWMLTERIMHECIKKLFGNYDDPDEENIEALCKLMSTIGEMIDHAKAKEHMDVYFDIMQKMSTSQKLSSRVRFMLRDSIDLRKNKWQQRRKVEGPKKIEEVHRDAAQERHAQSSRLGRGPAVSSVPRRGAPPMDYGPRGSSALASPSSQQGSIRGMPPHSRGFGSQDIRFEEKHQFDSRTVPLPQRAIKDDAITLGPQGGLARGMSIRGQPPASNAELPSVVDHRRIVSGSNGYNSLADRTSGRTPASSQSAGPSQRPASQEGRSGNKSYSEDDLREKSISAIREYYSAKDEKEVALCIEELNAPSFYPSVVSLWVNDSFERKDMERELLAKLFVSLCSGRHNLLSKRQLTDGLASVLTSLEDTLSDAPRATEYLGRLLARFVQENILPLQEVGKLIQEGGEEPGHLVQDGIAADILWAVLDSIRLEKGDSFLDEVKSSSSLKLEDFRPQHLKRSKLDAFM